jgi:hypothetical protein
MKHDWQHVIEPEWLYMAVTELGERGACDLLAESLQPEYVIERRGVDALARRILARGLMTGAGAELAV